MRSITATFSIIIATLTVAQGSAIHRNLKLGNREVIGDRQRRLEEEYASSKAPYYEDYSSNSQNDTSAVASASSVSYFSMDYIKESKKHHPVAILVGVVAGITLIVLGASKAKKRKVNNKQLTLSICQQDHDLESRFDSVAKLTTGDSP